MRRALALATVLLCALQGALGAAAAPASSDSEQRYVVDGTGRRAGVDGALVLNGRVEWPHRHETNLTVTVEDAVFESVLVQVCHEWTYNDASSHATVTCVSQCSPTLTTALHHPADPDNVVYRVIVMLFQGAHGCAGPATTGRLAMDFS